MRIFLGFFGLTRSLFYTASSILRCIEEPLIPLNAPIIKIGHFNLPDIIYNPRSAEIRVVPNSTESKLLNLTREVIEPQVDYVIENVMEVVRAFPDCFGDDYISARNLCHQLNSLRKLWSMIQKYEIQSDDIILFLRPDLFYVDQLQLKHDIYPLIFAQADILVPAWQAWGGFNDRFAFCRPDAAAVYASRFDGIIEACLAMNGLHAETYLHSVIMRHNLRVKLTDIRAARIRSNGAVADFDRAMQNSVFIDTSG